MATVSETLSIALQHHQAGRLHEAGQIYRQVLAADPNNSDAWHLLGVTARHAGKSDDAFACIKKAIEVNPDFAEAHYNLGIMFQEQGKNRDAVAYYRRAVELKPDYAEAYNNLGLALNQASNAEEAITCFRRSLDLSPDYVEAQTNLGNALRELGRLEEAVSYHRRAIELKPDYVVAHNNLGNALKGQGKLGEAAASYRTALELEPNDAEIWHNLGQCLQKQERLDEAIACYRQALNFRPQLAQANNELGLVLKAQGQLDEAVICFRRALVSAPDSAEAHNSLGTVLQIQGKASEVAACYRKALELKPNYADSEYNLGIVLKELGNIDEAATCFRRALELNPDLAEAHVNLSFAMLIKGNFEAGWREYEWRWKTGQLPVREFAQPQWAGESLAGRTILLHAEQGFGDTIQFIRYAPLVKKLGANVVVECQRPLLALLASCPGIDRLIGAGVELPDFDFHAALLSLPAIFKTTLGSIPASVPYLFADEALVAQWRAKLETVGGFRIGINWHGREGNAASRQRDIPLADLASLAQLPGVRLVSLQKGAGRRELSAISERIPIVDPGENVDQKHGAFMDTAAIMMDLDLVITSDTSVLHVAGALGVPVWVALPFVPDWRWLLNRSDSPWYPTMRLFRQTRAGDWAGVFEEISAAIRALLNAR